MKKFADYLIKKIKTSSKRKFIIKKDKKKFEIKNNWLKQNDANSCGYYLIHNSNRYIKIPDYEGNPEKLKRKINLQKQERGEGVLSKNSNLPFSDLNKYFQSKGLITEQFNNPHFERKNLEEKFEKGDFDLIYMTTNNHYTGIIKEKGIYFHLDSLKNKPLPISKEKAKKMILNSLGKDHTGRMNLVGLVKNPNIKFRIK